MIEIISGTNRPGSATKQIAHHVQGIFSGLKVETNILDLAQVDFSKANLGNYSAPPEEIKPFIERVNRAEALFLVVPEYNGSYPGILKLFIDYWSYPTSFEHRPVAFVGLGYRWGGLRPIEHLQQVFGYRNAYVFPNRVFIQNIGKVLSNGTIQDPLIADLLNIQAAEFSKFLAGLKSQELDATSKLKIQAQKK